jgi:sulfur carrier protein
MRPKRAPSRCHLSDLMRIVLNGQNESVSSENVDDLVNSLALVREAVLVEHNGVALLRSEWPQTALSDGDEIEILNVAAGG